MQSLTLLFPHHLFKEHPAIEKGRTIILVEDHLYFTQFPFHKKKLILHRALRTTAYELKNTVYGLRYT